MSGCGAPKALGHVTTKRGFLCYKAYQKAIEIRSDMAVLHSNLAYAYFGDKKYEQAIASFRQALAMDPELFSHSGSRNGPILQDRTVGDCPTFAQFPKNVPSRNTPGSCIVISSWLQF